MPPVETRVVGGGVDRCNLLEDPRGDGRAGIAGVADADFPGFVVVVVLSVTMEV